ncbi:hypothetical protein DY000_02039963 [Brassica cretica]|uniref:Uncharacterized protein n=1 Tax=Brassica cretica TaxID=69181 RepID=A0ABQ7B5E3_BRACR|nr:hypothetical protein DY000_02039963 [Brassica cretica]
MKFVQLGQWQVGLVEPTLHWASWMRFVQLAIGLVGCGLSDLFDGGLDNAGVVVSMLVIVCSRD